MAHPFIIVIHFICLCFMSLFLFGRPTWITTKFIIVFIAHMKGHDINDAYARIKINISLSSDNKINNKFVSSTW